jgi:hypothetical protein
MFARAKDSKDAYKENGNDIRIIGTRWGKTKVYQLRSPFCDYALQTKAVYQHFFSANELHTFNSVHMFCPTLQRWKHFLQLWFVP